MTGKDGNTAVKNKNGDPTGAFLALQPKFDEFNRIVGCQLRRKVATGKEFAINYYPFKNPNEQNTIFHSMLTNQAYTMFDGDHGNLQMLIVETNLTQYLLENESLFCEHQKRNIL